MKKIIALLEKRYVKFIFLAVSGILTGLTVCFPVLGFLEWFSIIPMALVLLSLCESENHRLRSLYAYGLFYFMCYFVVTWHWFYVMYPMSYTGMTELAALSVLIAAMLGLPFVQAWLFAFSFVFARLIYRGYLMKKLKMLFPFIFAAIWTILEWCQTLFWFGVPWGRLSIGQTSILVTAQTASLFGCYFITFLLVSVNFLLAYAIFKYDARKLFALTAAAVFSFNVISGSIIMLTDSADDSERHITVAAVQGNISTAEKWDDNWFEKTTDAYKRLTKEAVDNGADVIIWPETVIPVADIYSYASSFAFITRLANELDVTLIVGTNVMNDDSDMFNSLIVVYPDGSIDDKFYAKQNLVPFGEYMPMKELLSVIIPSLTEVNIMGDEWTPGNSSTVIDIGNAKMGSAICFDSIYDATVRKSIINGAEFIVISTNDSWFYDSAATTMHLGQAKLRAIENGRYVARSASTGISAIINANGQAIDIEPPLTEGYAISEISLRQSRTLYSYIGNIFVYLLISAICAIVTTDIIIKYKIKKEKKDD